MKSIFIDFQNIKTYSFNGKIVAEFAYEVFDSDTELRDSVVKQLIVSDDDTLSFADVHSAAMSAIHQFQNELMENQ